MATINSSIGTSSPSKAEMVSKHLFLFIINATTLRLSFSDKNANQIYTNF